ncbi:MAG: hypothetical protein AB9879_09815 [Methanothrix sp.]
MSDKTRSRTFWQGTSGSIVARVTEKHRIERLQGEMGRARIQAQYAEMKARRKCRQEMSR